MKGNHKHLTALAVLLLFLSCTSNNTTIEETSREEQVNIENKKEETSNSLSISANSFMGVALGDEIAQLSTLIHKDKLRTSEGEFTIYRLRDENGNNIAYCLPDPNNVALIGSIIIHSAAAQTDRGIHVGTAFSELLAIYPDLEVHGSEIEGRTYALINNGISCRLDTPNFSYEVDRKTITGTIQVLEIELR